MATYRLTLGGTPVTVHAPAPGEFDRAAFDADLPAGGLYGLDTETTPLETGRREQWYPGFRARLVQIATERVAWVLDLADPLQHKAAADLLADEGTRFASHTAMDVVTVWRHFGIDIIDRSVDTRALGGMTRLADERAGADLKTLTSRFIGPELQAADGALDQRFRELWPGRKNAPKSEVATYGWENIPTDDPVYTKYAGLDAMAARRLAPVLAKASKAPRGLVDREVWLANEAARIQLRGVRVDVGAVHDLARRTEDAMAGPTARFTELTGLTPTQGAALRDWLPAHGLNTTGLPTTKSGALSLTRKNLGEVRAQAGGLAAEALDALIERQAYADDAAKTAEWLRRMDPEGRLHPQISTVGATTARMSCSAPNLQTVSKKLNHQRACFLADPGYTLVTVDFDQVELRVAAALGGEQSMYETVLAGGDLHSLTAERTGVDRATAKIVNFLIVYGGGASALSAATGKPRPECKSIIDAFFGAYPALRRLADRAAATRGELVTVTGRRIPAPPGREYANINYLIQSSARDLLVGAWWRLSQAYPGVVWLPIHDELVLQAPNGMVEEVMAAARQAMNFPFRGMPITAEPVPLIDEDGVSRWMTADRAERLEAARAVGEGAA